MYFLVSLIFLFFPKYSLSGVKVVCGIYCVMFNNNQYIVYKTETVKVQLGTHSTNCPTKSRQTFVA